MHAKGHSEHGSHAPVYLHLAAMTLLSFAAMYGLMYAMVDGLDNVIPNFNQFYMASLMTSPMVILELIFMRGMYPNQKRNLVIMALAVMALLLFWVATREQLAIGDKQFLKSMIPHHAGAILMCNKAKLEDPDLKKLCREIITSQQREIDFMKAKLREP